MIKNIELSIIVPVYNADKYLHQCIESILNQSFHNFELILVNDGSTDLSGQICDEYARMDKRVHVIHKRNGGNTSARRAGLDSAEGNYVGFVDSDDWIEPEMYDQLLRIQNQTNADMVSSGYYRCYENSESIVLDDVEDGYYDASNYNDIINVLLGTFDGKDKHIIASLCCKLFKKGIIQEVMKRLPDIIQYGEDLYCTVSATLKSESIYVSHNAFYHYRMHANSIVHTKDDSFFIKLNQLFLGMRDEIVKYPAYKEVLLKQLAYNITDSLIKGINYRFDYGVEISVPDYYLPTDLLGSSKNIVLYGAGKVGKEYYKEFLNHPEYNLVGWVDKNYEAYCRDGMRIMPIEHILQVNYDLILLGTMYEGMANSMTEVLLELGVDKKKIVWCKPRSGITLH